MAKDQRQRVKPGGRAKTWAPKVRTGCQTCRSRHVKCDEQKPTCRRCAIAGYTCSGVLSSQPKGLPRSGQSPPDATTPSDSASSDSQLSQTPAAHSPAPRPLPMRRQYKPPTRKDQDLTPVIEIRPPDWYYSEAVGFFNTCVLDKIKKLEAIPVKYHKQAGKNEANYDAFIAFILAYRITQISQDHGTLVQPSEAYHTKHLWERLYTCISNQISRINHEIAHMDSSDTARNRVLTRIQGIKCVELMLQSPSWRLHTEGFLSLLRFCGGARFAQGRQALIRNAKGIIMESVLANSAGPPNNQIVGVSYFTTEELLFFYGDILHPSFPCPTELFERIIETNDLRIKIYSTRSHEHLKSARTILQQIDAFEPRTWTETSYQLPDIQEVPLMASIYRLAVGLFSLMALQPAGLRSTDKIQRRSSLLRLLAAAWKLEHCRDALNWPLAVAGCALADNGTPSEQAFICQCLKDAAKNVFSVHPPVILSRLRRFWSSGMLQWDKCWREPCPIIG